jgi:hypothetical protein
MDASLPAQGRFQQEIGDAFLDCDYPSHAGSKSNTGTAGPSEVALGLQPKDGTTFVFPCAVDTVIYAK